VRSHANGTLDKALPLHVVALILSHLDDVGDLARVTRTSRLLYYMTLPRLYENVTLRSYSEVRYRGDGRPEGFGNGSPFAMALNTLVSRPFAEYVQSFRVVGDWREHDVEDYGKGRVPDNSMMLMIAMRAALDRMKNLKAFAWELNTKPLLTVYQSIMAKPSITSLTLRFGTKRIPRPTAIIPPLPNLRTLVVYDIDPLCYHDDISLLLLSAKKLENLKMHWNPRMRDSGEESVTFWSYWGRCIAAKQKLQLKRIAFYNLYARNSNDGLEHCIDERTLEEVTFINCMGSSDPMTVFLDETWRVNSSHPVPTNLKMVRWDSIEKEHVEMMAQQSRIERLYLISKRPGSKTSSVAATPGSPPTATGTPFPNGASANGTPVSEHQCKGLAGDYLAVIQAHHRDLRHLLLSDLWQLSDNALFKLCQSLPHLEQLGFSCGIPPIESLRQIISLLPKLWAIRILMRPGSGLAETMVSMDPDMHQFVLATEFWKPEYKNLKYVALGNDFIFKLGKVVRPPKPKPGSGTPSEAPGQERGIRPMREMTRVTWEDVQHIEIWGMDTTEFDPKFP
jgi:hypothetical protein